MYSLIKFSEDTLNGSDMNVSSVLFMKKKYSLWTVLAVLQEYMKISGITSDHTIEAGRKHVFIIQHELGENWSIFAKELLSLIFTTLAEVRADISTTPNVVKAEVILCCKNYCMTLVCTNVEYSAFQV